MAGEAAGRTPGADNSGPSRRGAALTRAAVDSLPPVWLVLGAILSLQFGAAIAKSLFDVLPPSVVVWLRLLTAVVLLVLIARPALRGHSRTDWLVVLGFGLSLAVMNWAIYQAFALIPLGVAVTIEFLGPLAIAVLGSRRRLDLLWGALAVTGVALLGWNNGDLNLAGVGFALLAAGAWAAYILLSAATGQRFPGTSGLALASIAGAVLLTPSAVLAGGAALLDWRLVAIGLAVGVMSSVIPYSLELQALRRMPAQVFGILMSLQPAAAALAGLVLLGEFLTAWQWLAVACVIAASLGAMRAGGSATSRSRNGERASSGPPD